MNKIHIFEKKYDGESICDIYRDVSETVNERFNPALSAVPKDEHGFQKGTFTVKIEWVPETF